MEGLRLVHAYLEDVLDAAIRAVRNSPNDAIALLKWFFIIREEARPEYRLTPQFIQFLVATHVLDDDLAKYR